MVLEERSDHFNVGLLVGGDFRRTDAEEYEANRREVVGNFFHYFFLYGAILACFEVGGESGCCGFESGAVYHACVERCAEVVDLAVEGVDFSLVVGLNALEAVAEVVGYAGLKVERGLVGVVSGGGLVNVGVRHVPYDRRFEGDCEVFVYVEVEVKSDFGCEVVPVFAGGLVEVFVAPACTGYCLDREGTAFAIVASKEVEEVDCAIHAYIRVIEGCG